MPFRTCGPPQNHNLFLDTCQNRVDAKTACLLRFRFFTFLWVLSQSFKNPNYTKTYLLSSNPSPAQNSPHGERHEPRIEEFPSGAKMNTNEWRSTRGIRRRKAVFDLNVALTDLEGTSASVRVSPIVPSCDLQRESEPSHPPPAMIDVDAIEDDVVESSASAFAEARSKSTGARRRRLMVDVESGGSTTRLSPNKRRRVPPNQPVIDCEHVQSVCSSKAPPPPPPEEPKFSCPICMCPFTEEMSTKCGHIFCKGCIKMAISRQNKCPTCRKKVTAKELIRVFLPTTR
ncbi:E3 ubiquitin-protein ligase COP1 isoform X1 [Brassica napus]|nr:E3 ubiquitin-protein ligase COP1 isoform X1 [Brassica napus]